MQAVRSLREGYREWKERERETYALCKYTDTFLYCVIPGDSIRFTLSSLVSPTHVKSPSPPDVPYTSTLRNVWVNLLYKTRLSQKTQGYLICETPQLLYNKEAGNYAS